jgi:hypothetical protein
MQAGPAARRWGSVEPVGWRALLGRSVVLGALVVSIVLGRSALADPLVNDPGRAEATVVSTGTTPEGRGFAAVRFATARGPMVTRIGVSTSYAAGDTLAVVYDRGYPSTAARAETQPSLTEALVVPVALLLPAVLAGLRELRRGRRRHKLRPPQRARRRLTTA